MVKCFKFIVGFAVEVESFQKPETESGVRVVFFLVLELKSDSNSSKGWSLSEESDRSGNQSRSRSLELESEFGVGDE